MRLTARVQAIAALGNPTNVMDALGAILTVAQNAQAGTIIAGSIGTTELADDAVTAAKIDDGAVGRAALAASAVTPAKVDFTGDDLTIGANGKKLIINGPIVLSANSYGDSTPVSGDPGQLFFKKI